MHAGSFLFPGTHTDAHEQVRASPWTSEAQQETRVTLMPMGHKTERSGAGQGKKKTRLGSSPRKLVHAAPLSIPDQRGQGLPPSFPWTHSGSSPPARTLQPLAVKWERESLRQLQRQQLQGTGAPHQLSPPCPYVERLCHVLWAHRVLGSSPWAQDPCPAGF